MSGPETTNSSVLSADEKTNGSLLERFTEAVSKIESQPQQSVRELSELQHAVARNGLFSFRDETIDDISTSSLPLLRLEHHLAMAHCVVPTTKGEIALRLEQLQHALNLWNVFFRNLEALELLSKDELEQYETLVQACDAQEQDTLVLPHPVSRNVKIARFKALKAAENESQRLESLKLRRQRLGITETEQLDGHDEEGLERTLALTRLDLAKAQALEEWSSTLRELPMIARMAAQDKDRPPPPRPSPPKQGGLKVTHVTQNNTTGQLQFRREQIQSNVFRPSWNQPTMSLQELGELEYQAAMERSHRQAAAETADVPRKYADLVQQGLEDDADLVEASADLDRKWDDFKDANPRGSGNKRGDVGDRNF